MTLPELWAKVFPMVLPPERDDGLGVIVLNSNADTHFSFTNALGMVSAEQVRHRDRRESSTRGLLDHRPASSRRRISAAGESPVGTHRHGIDQRQLVHAHAPAPGGAVPS